MIKQLGTIQRAGGKTVSRRTALRTGGAAAAGAALVGRASSTTFAAPLLQTDAVELVYWHGWTEQWEEMVQFVVDSFHQKQSRITIKPEVVAGTELLTKLTAAIAAGNPPDVVTLFGSTAIPTLASEGAILSLNEIEGVDFDAISAWMNPEILKLGQYQDNLYGLSYWAGCYGIISNAKLLAEAGIEGDGPKTVEELTAMADTLTVRNDDGEIDRLGFLPEASHSWLWGTVSGGSFYDAAANKVTPNDPKIVEAMTWYQSFAEKYDPAQLAAFSEGLASERAQNLDPLLNGNFAMQVQGPWKLGDIKKYGDEFQYAVVAPPAASEAVGTANWIWGDIQVIPKGTKDAAAAADFVQFTAGVNDPEGYAQRVTWGERPINIPVSSSVFEVESFKKVVADYPGFQTFIDSLFNASHIGSPPVISAAAYYSDRLNSAVESIMLLETEPQAAMDSLAADVQKELDRASA